MEKAIARISRENHLTHLTRTLPFITVVFVIQCFLIRHFSPSINIGDYALYLAVGLICFLVAMVYYDSNHHVLIYPNHLLVYFPLMGVNRKILFDTIASIEGPKEECHFSSLVIRLKDKESVVFYFVDYPVQVKELIEKQIKSDSHSSRDSENSDSAA